jgi:hypothetical protein
MQRNIHYKLHVRKHLKLRRKEKWCAPQQIMNNVQIHKTLSQFVKFPHLSSEMTSPVLLLEPQPECFHNSSYNKKYMHK